MRPARPDLLAALAATLCLACGGGTTPAPETVDADHDGVTADLDCDDHDPLAWRNATAYRDADGDGYGTGAAVTVCTGTLLPFGYASTGGDCNEGDALAWQAVQAFHDADGDGIGEGALTAYCVGATPGLPPGAAAVGGDCAPNDATAWELHGYLYRDADGDGLWVASAGTICAGMGLPLGYAVMPQPLDCDDTDPTRTTTVTGYLDADGDGRGAGSAVSLCTAGTLPAGYAQVGEDCAPQDAARWQVLSYALADADGDGYTVAASGEVCAGASLPAPYATTSAGPDCDDADLARWATRTAWADADGDGAGSGEPVALCTGASLPAGYATAGGDCAPADATRWRLLPYAWRDADRDTWFAPVSGEVCVGAALPGDYALAQPARSPDCDDTDPSRRVSAEGYPDADGDGVGGGLVERFCGDGSLPAGYVPSGTDCASADPARWQLLAYTAVDRDGDGVTALASGSVCAGVALPEPYRTVASGNDCDDADPSLWRAEALYLDQDGDGVGAPPRSVQCLGVTRPAGWVTAGYDTDDLDPVVTEDGELLALLLEIL